MAASRSTGPNCSQRPDQRPTGQDTTASPDALGRPETGATETVATNDIAVAFAALRVELAGLLGRVAETRTNDELREDNDENRPPEQFDVVVDKADHLREATVPEIKSVNATIGETETPIPTPTKEEVAETPRKRPWWRRVVG
jgi:hypothetical protein